MCILIFFFFFFFFFNDTATPEIYTLPLHDALPISASAGAGLAPPFLESQTVRDHGDRRERHRGAGQDRREQNSPDRIERDRKSTRLNSSHLVISYAVFCLKKKKKQ